MQTKLPFSVWFKLQSHRVYRKAAIELKELNYLFWETTLRCNLNCRHCGSDCMVDSSVNDMPVEDFLAVLEEISTQYNPKTITTVITGGEPLMRKDLAECGRKIAQLGYPWGIVTNGFLLDQTRFDQLLASGLRCITISIDGLQASHDWMRGREGSFDKAVAAARMVASVAQQRKLAFDIVTCINNRNFDELEEIRDTLIDSGVKYWRIFNIFPKGRAVGDKELDITPEKFVKLLEFIEKTQKEGKIYVSYACEGYLGPWETRVRKMPFLCRAGISVGSVLIDGSISACPSLRADYIQGNIYKDSFLDVWNNRFENMRNREHLRTGECAECKSFKYCQGNGLHLRDESTGKLLRCHLKMIEEAT
ncbi:MAG: TIGR04133 family radical SAM/SPASM protein [Spirochaetales bacterium]|nr:TIGR04133 family radical SAM/SPASM protein [Spirochaetales bacterium]